MLHNNKSWGNTLELVVYFTEVLSWSLLSQSHVLFLILSIY